MKSGTIICKVNGVRLDSDNDQTKNYNGVEFFTDTTQRKLRVRKLYVKDENAYGENRKLLGIDLGMSALKKYSDRVTIRYQQEAM